MTTPNALQLASLELHTWELVHPDWLRGALGHEGGVEVPQTLRTNQTWGAALSRWLIDTYALPPLRPESFARSWTYAVLGGHEAVDALYRQALAYLAGSWVRRAVAGVQARALHTALGEEGFAVALSTEPLANWQPPERMPAEPLTWLRDSARSALDALWERAAPAHAAWARMMMPMRCDLELPPPPPAMPEAERELQLAPGRCTSESLLGAALLAELDTRLQADFALETDASAVEVRDGA
jgi:hypothetical protein